MKKILASLTLIVFLAVPLITSAASWWEDLFKLSGSQPAEAPETDVMIILDSLTNWLLAILLVIAAIFIIIAATVFFFVVRPIVKWHERQKAAEVAAEPTTRECPFCLTNIAIKATRCPNCTSELKIK